MLPLSKEKWTPGTPLQMLRQRYDQGAKETVDTWHPVKFVSLASNGDVIVEYRAVSEDDGEIKSVRHVAKNGSGLRVLYAEMGMADTRYCQGTRCTWHGPIQEAAFDANTPICPHCGQSLYAWDNVDVFTNNVAMSGCGESAYADWIASWRERKCVPTRFAQPDDEGGRPVPDTLWDWRAEFEKWKAGRTVSKVQSVSRCSIERVIFKTQGGRRRAEFNCVRPELGDGPWRAVDVLEIREGVFQIRVFSGILEPEQAAALATGIQMAIDWVSEAGVFAAAQEGK